MDGIAGACPYTFQHPGGCGRQPGDASWFMVRELFSLVFFEPLASFNVGRGLPEHVFALFSPEFIMEDFSRDVGPDSVLKSYFRKRFSKIAR